MTTVPTLARQVIDQLDNITDAWNELVDAIVLKGLEHQGFANWETWAVWKWLHEDEQRLASYIKAFPPERREEMKIQHYFEDGIPLLSQDSIYRTLLASSIRCVDWYEILERLEAELKAAHTA